ncbi:MAG: DUF1189 family protein [Anaerobutyricum sp.]|nr:DUF1189 family protein [Anaerobutyricum sp.]
MEQDSKIGFWEQYVIACFRPSKYNELLKKKKNNFVVYLFILILFLVFIESVIPFAAWNTSVGGLRNLFTEGLPAFSVADGQYHSEAPISFTINGVIRVRADSGVEQFKKSDFDEKYAEEFLIGKTNALVKTPGGIQNISLSEFASLKLDNRSLAEAVPAIYSFLIFYLFLLIGIKAVQFLFTAFMFGLICRSSVRTKDGKVVSMKESFYIASYARTLFAILASVNIALGYMFDSMMLVMISAMLTIGFIIRAEASVLQPDALN